MRGMADTRASPQLVHPALSGSQFGSIAWPDRPVLKRGLQVARMDSSESQKSPISAMAQADSDLAIEAGRADIM
jgi:hypothetical protein